MNRRTALAHIGAAGAGSLLLARKTSGVENILACADTGNHGMIAPRILPFGPKEKVTSIAFSADGSKIAADVSHVHTGATVDYNSLDGSGRPPRLIVTGKPMVRVWDAESGALLQDFAGHSAPICALSFSPDGKRLVSAGAAGYQAARREQVENRIDMRAEYEVGRVHSLTARWDGALVKIWDLEAGRETLSLTEAGKPIAAVAISDIITAVDGDMVVRMWTPADGRLQLTLDSFKRPPGANNLAFSRDARRIVHAAASVIAWDLLAGRAREFPGRHPDTRGPAAFSHDGRRFACFGTSKQIELWDFESLELIRRFEPKIEEAFNTTWLSVLTFSSDGTRLASAERDGKVCIWNVETGRRLAEGRGPSGKVLALTFLDGGGLRGASFGPIDSADPAKAEISALTVWDLSLA